MKIKINGKKSEVDFWDFFKMAILSHLLFSGIVIMMLFMFNIMFAL